MGHLIVHLPLEAKIAGPVGYQWMYPIERYLGKLKKYVRNKARPEGSIAEAYIVNEALTFCSMYLRGIEKRFNRAERNDDGVYGQEDGGLSVFSQKARPFGSRQLIRFSHEDIRRAHWYVMNNCEELQPYLEEHMKELEKENCVNVQQRQELLFPSWFKNHMTVLRNQGFAEATDQLYSLACGPDFRVKVYAACIVNGVWIMALGTKRRCSNSPKQNEILPRSNPTLTDSCESIMEMSQC